MPVTTNTVYLGLFPGLQREDHPGDKWQEERMKNGENTNQFILVPMNRSAREDSVIDGLAGLVQCKTKDKRTEASRAEELTKEVNNWCLSYQTKVRGDSPSL